MPLMICDKPFGEGIHSSQELYSKYAGLERQSKELFDPSETRVFDCTAERVIYVLQAEYAVVSPKDETIDWIMTDDTTTCVTGLIRHCQSGISVLTHYDKVSDKDLFEAYLHEVLQLIKSCSSEVETNNVFDLYLIGGYCDERGISEKIYQSLLHHFHSFEHHFNLKCAFIGPLNTKFLSQTDLSNRIRRIAAPVVYGVAVNVKTGSLVSATLNRENLSKNECPVPLWPLRRVCVSYGIYSNYRPVYDPVRQMAKFDSRVFSICNHTELIDTFKFILRRYSDQDILARHSSSPFVEPSHFVQDFRDVLKFLIVHSGKDIDETYFRNARCRYFRLASRVGTAPDCKLYWEESG